MTTPEISGIRIAVVVASKGRPEEIGQLMYQLDQQTLKPAMVVLSVTTREDIPPKLRLPATVIIGEEGLCKQRNRGIDAISDRADIVVFFDDDFLPSETTLENLGRLMIAEPDIVGATGLVLRDGARTGEVSYDAALDELTRFADSQRPPPINRRRNGLYGCNMAIRMSAIGSLRFDENLVRYGWQEDIDFSARVGGSGRLVMTTEFFGIHRGVSKSRSSGLALGYSQMVNPRYLVRKGTMPSSMAFRLMIKNLLANHVKAIRPEPHIDRAGRARGNRIGLLDIILRKENPRKVLNLIGNSAAPNEGD